jgi:hypothetical protein
MLSSRWLVAAAPMALLYYTITEQANDSCNTMFSHATTTLNPLLTAHETGRAEPLVAMPRCI